jgi:hypothetical protein
MLSESVGLKRKRWRTSMMPAGVPSPPPSGRKPAVTCVTMPPMRAAVSGSLPSSRSCTRAPPFRPRSRSKSSGITSVAVTLPRARSASASRYDDTDRGGTK